MMPPDEMGLDPDDWRDYLAVTELRLSPLDILEMSAVQLDWLLAIHGVLREFKGRSNGDRR